MPPQPQNMLSNVRRTITPKLQDVLSNVRRTISRLRGPRVRLPRPRIIPGPDGQVLAPDGPIPRRDPQLDPFAEMLLVIGSGFWTGTSDHDMINSVYDQAQHKYRPGYLHGPLSIGLSAQPGLKRYQSTLLPNPNPSAPLRTSPAGGAGPMDDVGALVERLKSPPPDMARLIAIRLGGGAGPTFPGSGVEGQDPRLPPPKDLLAYDWVVASADWSHHTILQKPTRDDTLTSFVLPGPGDYTVRMRVWFTGNRFTEKTVKFSVQEKVIVGMGDSFASGQGNPDHWAELDTADPRVGLTCGNPTAGYASGSKPPTDEDAIWYEEKAHRSFNSGQAIGAHSLQDVYAETWNKDTGPNTSTSFKFTKVTFASFARTGAKITDGLINPQEGLSDFVGAGQIEECRRTFIGRSIDALLISIGGNDAGFAGVLEDLVKGDSFYVLTGGRFGVSNPQQVKTNLDKLLGVNLQAGQKGQIEIDLDTLRGAIDTILRKDVQVGEIYLAGYPVDLFYVEGNDGRLQFSACDIFTTESGLFSISPAEAAMIKKAGQTLNTLLKRKAGEFGWHFVDVAADFAGRGYCRNDAQAMWVRAEESCRNQGDFDGTMHPNERGHAAYGLRYGEQLRKYSM
jgi:hypothetical protein